MALFEFSSPEQPHFPFSPYSPSLIGFEYAFSGHSLAVLALRMRLGNFCTLPKSNIHAKLTISMAQTIYEILSASWQQDGQKLAHVSYL